MIPKTFGQLKTRGTASNSKPKPFSPYTPTLGGGGNDSKTGGSLKNFTGTGGSSKSNKRVTVNGIGDAGIGTLNSLFDFPDLINALVMAKINSNSFRNPAAGSANVDAGTVPNPVTWGAINPQSGKKYKDPRYPSMNGGDVPGDYMVEPFAAANNPVMYSGMGDLRKQENPSNYWNANFNNWNDIRRLRDMMDISTITGELRDVENPKKPVYYYGGGGRGGYGGWGGYSSGRSSPYDFFFNLLNWRI